MKTLGAQGPCACGAPAVQRWRTPGPRYPVLPSVVRARRPRKGDGPRAPVSGDFLAFLISYHQGLFHASNPVRHSTRFGWGQASTRCRRSARRGRGAGPCRGAILAEGDGLLRGGGHCGLDEAVVAVAVVTAQARTVFALMSSLMSPEDREDRGKEKNCTRACCASLLPEEKVALMIPGDERDELGELDDRDVAGYRPTRTCGDGGNGGRATPSSLISAGT
ncbi:hypothetical protein CAUPRSCDRAFT_11122 [Caulochytrium protostelioides]|uniref:Uncharacterized protein n=1 Tax=Caulochytrium protostelioides TaxID=1555241 RepID=A0A4P9WV61_9FUNG|nr:hypothetical protein CAUPRSCDRAFT_11122 [Caulochytrium protostelioides]